MKKKMKLLFVVLSTACIATFAQSGGINVTAIDADLKDSIPFASVVIVREDSSHESIGMTDINGRLQLNPLAEGKYNIKVSFPGYQTVVMTGVIVSGLRTSYVSMKLRPKPIIEPIALRCCITMCTIEEDLVAAFEDSVLAIPLDSMAVAEASAPIESVVVESIKFYPNPTDGKLFIESFLDTDEFYLLNPQGKLVETLHIAEVGTMEFALGHLPNGIYFLQYFDNEKWTTEKLVLNQ